MIFCSRFGGAIFEQGLYSSGGYTLAFTVIEQLPEKLLTILCILCFKLPNLSVFIYHNILFVILGFWFYVFSLTGEMNQLLQASRTASTVNGARSRQDTCRLLVAKGLCNIQSVITIMKTRCPGFCS